MSLLPVSGDEAVLGYNTFPFPESAPRGRGNLQKRAYDTGSFFDGTEADGENGCKIVAFHSRLLQFITWFVRIWVQCSVGKPI